LTFQEYLAQQTRYKEIKKYIIQTIVVDEHAGQVVIVWGGRLSRSQENPWSASR
jgi:hypothetical protein